MGFSRQEYWSELPFPSPGDLPDPGIEPGSPALEADALTSEPPGKFNMGHQHGACLEFPREAGLILRGAVQAGNPFQTTQGSRDVLCIEVK